MGPRNGVPATQASRGAPRGDDPSRRNNADRIPSPIHFSNSHSRSRGAFCAQGLQLCFANPNRGVGGAPRNVRVLARHPWGTPSCVKDARERAYDAACQALARRLASHDAGRSPLGAPPWRFFTRGRASGSGMTRIRAASSSQPGRSAWRATSRASRGQRLRAAGRRTPLPAPPSGSSPETPLDERGCVAARLRIPCGVQPMSSRR